MSIVSFNEKVKKMDADIEEMQNREKQNLGKIEDLQD